ncbi:MULTISPECIES: replication initiation protein [unclassified Zobellia]|uniref:replication initiation protein n=1 Tax=unclassified Zobellia TaxID=2620635 RepID=UPI000B529C1B|nr:MULTISPECIES: replication initiation protein [unclassified Zobellia]MDO6818935.1 replication initiation protein [Zobellia sp. 1_MG-2023]OWW25071.1 hypothetical protein B4Q04_11020 [Zobellia sp. OII3]
MELRNKQLNQANFFTRSLFKLDKEIHKDIVYLIQSKIDFFGKPKSVIKISLNDYIDAKNTSKNDTYSFSEFYKFTNEVKNVGGAFYNKIERSFIAFNIVDNVQVDPDSPDTLKIELARFGKIFFYKEKLIQYINEITPVGKVQKQNGFTQIENSVFKIRGARRKKFYEILSQFKNTGFCIIAVIELKMILGYIEIIDKELKTTLTPEDQLKLIFIPEKNYEFKDKQPKFSYFERDFLKPAIQWINSEKCKDIKELRINRKFKKGRRISHIEFRFKPLKHELNKEELSCLEFFKGLGLDETQVIYLINRIGSGEMKKRWMENIQRSTFGQNQTAKYYDKVKQSEIKNISGFLYKNLFKELNKIS